MFVIVALLPFLVAVLLLLVCQWKISEAGWITLGVTIVLVSLIPVFHQTSWQVVLSLGESIATLLSAGVLLFPALLLFQMQQETGAIEVLAQGFARLLPNRDLQTALLVLGIGPCLEAICGFGCGTVAILPLLMRLHGDRRKALQLSLLNYLTVAWGGSGLGMALAADLAGLPLEQLSLMTALLLFPSVIGVSMLTLLISGGRKALERSWGVALCIGGLFLIITCLCSQFSLADLAGALAGAGVVTLVLLWGSLERNAARRSASDRLERAKELPLLSACLPYFLLIAGLFATRLIPPLRLLLQTFGVLAIPALKWHLALFSSPGVWLLLAALIHLPLFSLHGKRLIRIQVRTARQSVPGVVGLASFLATATLMQHSGMIALLGDVAAQSGRHYVWVASLVGAAAGWLTGTSPAGNALVVPLQVEVGTQVGLPLPWLIAAQNVSTAIGATLAPSRLMLLVASAGLFGQEGLVVRKTGGVILWSLGLTTLLLVWLSSSLWFVGLLVLLALLALVHVPLLSLVIAPWQWKDRWETWMRRSQHLQHSFLSLLLPFQSTCLQPLPRIRHLAARWGRWGGRLLAYGGLVLVNLLYASFSLVALGPLSRLDPVLFVCLSLALLAPVGGILLLKDRKRVSRENVSRGCWLGGFLSVGLLCYTLSLKDTGITEAMVFSTVNGVIATVIAWKVLGQPISTLTKWACLVALAGACLVWSTAPAKWQGDCLAFVGGVLLTGYAFHVERMVDEARQQQQSVQPIIGVQLVTMALITLVIALCVGRWETVSLLIPSDLLVLIYVSGATIVLPCFLMLVVQRTLSAVTVAFFGVVEPLVGAGFAYVSIGERLPMLAYLGGGIVIVGVVLQIAGGTTKQEPAAAPSGNALSGKTQTHPVLR